MMTASLKHAWFDSSLRYCDSLFVISCQNSSGKETKSFLCLDTTNFFQGEILAETQSRFYMLFV